MWEECERICSHLQSDTFVHGHFSFHIYDLGKKTVILKHNKHIKSGFLVIILHIFI